MRRPTASRNAIELTALAALTIAALIACRQPQPAPPSAPRLVLVGVDGGSWNLIDPLLAAGELPHLAALAERGVTADLEANVEPLISPAIWTSIATGRRPESHGVTAFTDGRRSIRVPTVWDRLAAGGLRVGLYDYLITWPPRDLPGGFVIPGWLRRDRRTAPPDVFEQAGVEPYSYEVVDFGTLDDVVAATRRELAEKPRTWNRLAAHWQPDVGAVVLFAVDVVSHHFWHTTVPRDPTRPVADPVLDTEPRFDGVIPETLRGIDRAVAEIVAALDDDDHVVVVSDHGFGARDGTFRRWGFDRRFLLDKAGFAAGDDRVSVHFSFLVLSLAVVPGPEEEREEVVERLESFFSAIHGPAGEPIFDVHAVREPQRVREQEVPDWMVELVEDRMPAYAFVFAVPIAETFDRLWPDGLVEIAGESHPLGTFATPHVFSGDHESTGIFFAAGAAFRHRPERARLSVLDLAPLFFYLAGRPIPDDLEGRFDESLIRPDYLAAHPPRRVPAATVPGLPEEPADAAEGASDAEIEERLRALGYVTD
jgi:Type I phosphodiesterase / nucleotide pyrophosphatase